MARPTPPLINLGTWILKLCLLIYLVQGQGQDLETGTRLSTTGSYWNETHGEDYRCEMRDLNVTYVTSDVSYGYANCYNETWSDFEQCKERCMNMTEAECFAVVGENDFTGGILCNFLAYSCIQPNGDMNFDSAAAKICGSEWSCELVSAWDEDLYSHNFTSCDNRYYIDYTSQGNFSECESRCLNMSNCLSVNSYDELNTYMHCYYYNSTCRHWTPLNAVKYCFPSQLYRPAPACYEYVYGTSGNISSPNWPNDYPNDAYCEHRIEVPKDLVINFTITSIDMEVSSWEDRNAYCEYDYIMIYEEEKHERYPIAGPFCGSSIPDFIVSKKNSIIVSFKSDGSGNGRGFEGTFNAVERCGGKYNGSSGEIISPGWPDEYPPNQDCLYKIRVPENMFVQLTFTSFETEYDYYCTYDYVEFQNYRSSKITYKNGTRPMLRKQPRFCGNSPLPESVYSTSNTMEFHFISDGLTNSKGFRAVYSAVERPCGGNFSGLTGNISSPNWPNQYPNNKTCLYNIRVPDGYAVQLNFSFFDLELDLYCLYDFIEVYDGVESEESKIGRFCGNNTITSEFTSTTNNIIVKFSSDNTNRSAGFFAHYKAGGFKAEQRDFYPYGPIALDNQLQPEGLTSWDYWYTISDPIKFSGGFPFGTDRFTYAHVSPHGVITLGRKKWAWWPSLEWTADYGTYVVAPFWSYMDPRKGSVYYHLYQRRDLANQTWNSEIYEHVLDRASFEVQEFLNKSGVELDKEFKATAVLVATWEEVEPYNWRSWYCDQFDDSGFPRYPTQYQQYCQNKQDRERNTFQTLLITDGEASYVLTTYKFGEMKWRFQEYRRIEVGYASPSKEFFKDKDYYNTEITTILDQRYGSTGRFGTNIDFIGKSESSDAKCEQWYNENLHLVNNDTYNEMIDGLFDCPCTLDRVGRQWWWYSYDEIIEEPNSYLVCLSLGTTAKSRLERLAGNSLNRMCCYKFVHPNRADYVDENGNMDYSGLWSAWWDAYRAASHIQYNDPNAGHVLTHDPWYWRESGRLSRSEDLLPHKWCCKDASSSKYCELFNQVRPNEECNPNATFVSGRALGDPHIKTVDGYDYTMNGLGEYILLEIDTEDFMLQGRTSEAITSEGNKTRATVFVAFAAQESDTNFQVELNDEKTGMVIKADGNDITNEFNEDNEYFQTFNDLLDVARVTRDDGQQRPTVTATFSSGISFTVYVGIRNLEFSVNLPTNLNGAGSVSGLLGNFDGNKMNEFFLPDGTQMSEADTDTERKILEDFADLWRVDNDNSVFTYENGRNTTYYTNTSFEPIFLEEVNATLKEEAENTCAGDYACVFDLIATGEEAFAKYSKATNSEANAIQESQANGLPRLQFKTDVNEAGHVQVKEGQRVELVFDATDPDGDNLNFTLVSPNSTTLHRLQEQGFQFDAQTGIVIFYPNISDPVSIGVQAMDTKGGRSVTQFVTLEVCTLCGGDRGSCDRNETRDREYAAGKFLINTCKCNPAFEGDDCNIQVDGCASRPCARGQTCRNLRINEDKYNEQRYRCGACPWGYRSGSAICLDINECEDTNSTICPRNSECVNSEGSFSCRCKPGFRSNALNATQCLDINECVEGTNNCEQICNNTIGGYNCSCLPGNYLSKDNHTCQQNSSLKSNCSRLECGGYCYWNNDTQDLECGCALGYQLDNVDKTCQDVNECEADNVCSQNCNNTIGGFNCSCHTGYKLEDDRTSCSACKYPYYGENCREICDCDGNGQCDPVKGCVCSRGWEGESCSQDKNECEDDDDNDCPFNKKCINKLGGYDCVCRDGYILVNGTCQDVDECEDIGRHNCNLNKENCVNSIGTFDCECKTGYYRNSTGDCQNVDECDVKIDNCQQICNDTEGSYNCECHPGFVLDFDRFNCKKDTDPCEGESLQCDHICQINQDTNTPYCLCNSGYTLIDDINCEDIKECKEDSTNLCSDTCVDTEGSYTCSCPIGKRLDNDGRTCVDCSDGTWGEDCSQSCRCERGAEECNPVTGCVCEDGFDGEYCEINIDECDQGLSNCNISNDEVCKDTVGSYRCDCRKGFHRVNGVCVDKNECARRRDNDCKQLCNNYVGGYNCSCFEGFELENGTCKDINECKEGTYTCEYGQACKNTPGSYVCECGQGFEALLNNGSCRDINECERYSPCDHTCTDYDGGYNCTCYEGYDLDSSDNSSCIKIYSTPFEMTLDYNGDFDGFDAPTSQAYLDFVEQLEEEILQGFKGYSTYARRVVIRSLSRGSVIVDAELIMSDDTQSAAQTVEALLEIAANGVEINGTLTEATVVLGNLTITPNTDKCELLELIEPCPNNTFCAYNSYGEAYCRSSGIIYGDKHYHCGRYNQECYNGGTCDTNLGTCECPEDFTGYRCQENILGFSANDSSCSLSCENGGTCYKSDTDNEEFCLCTPDFVGEYCDENRVQIGCDGENITLNFTPIEPFDGLVHIGDNVSNNDCLLFKTDDGVYSGSFPMDDTCGGFVVNDSLSDETKYKKELNIQYNSDFVDSKDIVFNVSCIHNTNGTQESIGDLSFIEENEKTKAEEEEKLYKPAKLTILSNPGKTDITKPVELGQRVYMVNYLQDTNLFKTLYVDSCTVTDPDHGRTITIFQGGCPAPKAAMIFFTDAIREQTPVGFGISHDISIFKLVPTTVRLSFSCNVRMCQNNNREDCELATCSEFTPTSRRKRQAPSESENLNRVVYEIYIVPTSNGISSGENGIIIASTNDNAEKGMFILVSVVACVLIVVLITILIVIVKKRQRKRAPNDTSQDVNPWCHLALARHDQPKQ